METQHTGINRTYGRKSDPTLREYSAKLFFMNSADLVGIMFLSKVFEGWLAVNQVSSQSSEVEEVTEMFYKATMELYRPESRFSRPEHLWL